MATTGSGGEAARPWTATSTWATAGGAAVEDAVSFETTEDDAEASPAGVVLSRPPADVDGDAPPCEVTVSFRGKYEIHRVYVRSTARIYELYHSTNTKGTGKDYLCTVRCGLAIKDPLPSGEESMAEWSTNSSTRENREHEMKSISSSSDDDSWVDVKISESPVRDNTSESKGRNVVRTCEETTLAHYEATAEMTDVTPCVSLTVRLLSLQSKASVHIEEIYIFADPVESTNGDSVPGPGNMGGSSLLAMLVPSLMQMSKSRNLKIDEGYFSNGSRTQLTQDSAIKESSPYEKTAQEAGSCSTDDSKYESARIESGVNPTDRGTVSNEKWKQGELQFKDAKSLPLPVQTTENTQVSSVTAQQVSNTDQFATPLVNQNFTPYNRIERKLDTLLSKVEKMELYCSRFEDIMIKPLGSIEARLQRLEQQFDSFSVDVQSLRASSEKMSAPDGVSDTTNSQEKAHNDGSARTPACRTDRQPGLAVRAPGFSIENSCGSDENQVNIHGPKVVPRLLVKVPEFISQPELTGEKLHEGTSSTADCVLSSEKERKTSPGLIVRVPEFQDDDDDDDCDDDDDDEVEEDKQVGDHDDGHTRYEDTLCKNTSDGSKSKSRVYVNGALASALEALLTSSTGTSSSEFVVCTAGAENTNDPSRYSLAPGKVDQVLTEDGLSEKFLGRFGNGNMAGKLISYQEADATPHTSLPKATMDGEEVNEGNNDLKSDVMASFTSTESLCVPSQHHAVEESIDGGSRVNEHDNDPNLSIASFIASTEPSGPPQSRTVFDSSDNGAQVDEPARSLAEFLASRKSGSCKNGTSVASCNNDGAEILSFERTSAGCGIKSKNISQLLVKNALEVDADDSNILYSYAGFGAANEGPSYPTFGNVANGQSNSTTEDEDRRLKNRENTVRLSVGMDSVLCRLSTTDSKTNWIEKSSLDWSLDDSISKPTVERSWSDLSSMESFNGAPAKEPVISANKTSADYVDLLADIRFSSTVNSIAGEELQQVCDLLYEYKDDLLGMTSTEKRTSESPSLEVLLGESSDSESQISDLEDIGKDAGFGSAQLSSSFTSSDDNASATSQHLVDVVDLPTQSEAYAAALNGPLIDVADLTNHSGTYAPEVNEPLAYAFDHPNPSEANGPLANVDDLPKPLDTYADGNSGERPDSLI